MSNEKTVAFIGLGAMGWGIAANLAAAAARGDVASPVTVWNRTSAKAERHAAAFGTRCAHTLSDVSRADVIITCLPTSAEVAAIVAKMAPELKAGSLWIDCTSGDPNTTRETARALERVGVTMVDSPVSGGPDGAKTGELTAMVGGDANRVAHPVISRFAKKKIVHCGPIGSGHAVKAVNNCLNAAHLIVGGEALIALAKWGVQPEIALNAINASSGRSLQTEVRLPEEVLSRKFDYGFKLGLTSYFTSHTCNSRIVYSSILLTHASYLAPRSTRTSKNPCARRPTAFTTRTFIAHQHARLRIHGR